MTNHSNLRIGTRKSLLALAQANLVKDELIRHFPSVKIELVPILTTGDIRTDKALAEIGGKGLFTKELEEMLLDGRIDMAVHSLKDMETKQKAGLHLAATLPREDARDALIAPRAGSLDKLPSGAKVGTSSLRRTALLRICRPDLEILPLRGNVQTRLDKLARGEVDATLLAVAGLARLHKLEVITERLDINRFIPAVGQGIIALECRRSDEALHDMLDKLNHVPSWLASVAERSLLAKLDGSCRTPIGAHAVLHENTLMLNAFVANPDGSKHVYARSQAPATEAFELGLEVAEKLLAQGGGECLA